MPLKYNDTILHCLYIGGADSNDCTSHCFWDAALPVHPIASGMLRQQIGLFLLIAATAKESRQVLTILPSDNAVNLINVSDALLDVSALMSGSYGSIIRPPYRYTKF